MHFWAHQMAKIAMTKGFVFGKFMPFHKGHKAMIDFAKTKVDFLYVVVCASESEDLPVFTRSHWITETYPFDEQIQIISFEYSEKKLPNTSIPDREVSALWAAQFKKMLPDADVVITSEGYGEFLAEEMGIESIVFDQERAEVPISATEIRNNIAENWDYIPDIVKRHYQKKVVLMGTECTGKSSLSMALAEELNASLVEETGREIIEDSTDFDVQDLETVIFEHARRIEAAVEELKPFIIIDTDIHITQSYAKFQLGEYLEEVPDEIFDLNRADHYFYLTVNFPFTQDGTRLPVKERNFLDKYHRATLKDYKIENKIQDIDGDWEERLQKMLAVLRSNK